MPYNPIVEVEWFFTLLVVVLISLLIGRAARPLKTFFLGGPEEKKDPMDWSLTESSTEWEYEKYCPQCKTATTFNEQHNQICGTCGYFDKDLYFRKRVTREIWNGERWVRQHKYGNGPDDFEIVY